jgi:hypothetical protein
MLCLRGAAVCAVLTLAGIFGAVPSYANQSSAPGVAHMSGRAIVHTISVDGSGRSFR